MGRADATDPVHVVLTIDTEPDDAWTNHLNPSVANVQELLRLQTLLDRYEAKATCLVTYRVIENRQAVDVLRRLVEESGAEIGAHLHPWETPPFMKSGLDVKYDTYPHELPLEVFEKKLSCLTEAIARHFSPPTSYRAGRWGLAAEHLRVLERLGYKVDTSVVPLVDWGETMGLPHSENGRGGIDYRLAPRHPYHPDYVNVTKEGHARLVEMPVSVAFNRRVSEFVRRRYGELPHIVHRLFRKSGVFRPIWALPAEQREPELLRMIDLLVLEGAGLINIALHSSELMLDGSPKSRTGARVDEIFRRIEAILAALACEDRTVFATLSSAARAHEPERNALVPRGRSRRSATQIAYILAASHSGSTLLAMLLGAHAQAYTVGELKAESLGDVNVYRCSCGTLIKECGFWAKVSEGMARRGIAFDITRAGTDIRTGASRYAHRLLQPLCRGSLLECIRDTALSLSPTWRRQLPWIQRINAALADTICEITGKRVIIDSSKIGIRLKYLLWNPSLDVRIVRLIRDGRAVALTYVDPYTFASARDPRMRVRGHEAHLSFEDAATQWLRSNEEADNLLARLDPSRWIQVRYEDYCKDPDGVLGGLYRFLGLDPARRVQDFRSIEHHVVGNSMRLDSTSEVRLDERWRDVLRAEQLAMFDRIAGRLNRKYGYE